MKIPSTTTHAVGVQHDAHPVSREFLMGGMPIVFITVHTTEAAGHQHHFSGLNRFGDAFCQSCGAEAWSPAWVKDGVFGDNTAEWSHAQWVRFSDLVDETAQALLERELGAEVIERRPLVAMLSTDMPAKPGRHRRGVPVPAMAYGVTTVSL